MNLEKLDITLLGLIEVFTAIAENTEGSTLTHAEVRSLARCTLPVIKKLPLPQSLENQVYFLVSCITSSGLPHYDRANCALRILRLIKDYREGSANEDKSYEEFF